MLDSIEVRIGNRSTGRLSAIQLRPLIVMLDSSAVLDGYDRHRKKDNAELKFSAVQMMTILLYMEIKKLTFEGLRERLSGRGGQRILENLGMPKKDGKYIFPSDGWISDFRNHEYPLFCDEFERELRDMILKGTSSETRCMTIDSTPAEASRYSDWDYNPHYRIRMAKISIVMIDGIPLMWAMSNGNAGDNPQYLELLDSMKHLECQVDSYADGGYDSFETYAQTFLATDSVMNCNQAAMPCSTRMLPGNTSCTGMAGITRKAVSALRER